MNTNISWNYYLMYYCASVFFVSVSSYYISTYGIDSDFAYLFPDILDALVYEYHNISRWYTTMLQT